MKSVFIDGVGNLTNEHGYWTCAPPSMRGVHLEIDGAEMSNNQISCAKYVCSAWSEIEHRCREYIEESRERYQLHARNFEEPSVIVAEEEWTVYFSTELDEEAVVGVEFRGDQPFQLIIGD